MSLEFILLGMLRKPASGYDLKVEFNEGARHFWSAELSQIYPTLEKMQRRGWLTSRREPSSRGPERRVYRRTPKGTRQLHAWLCSEPVMGAERFAYIGQLIFMAELHDCVATQRFLVQLRDRLDAFRQLLESAEADLRETHPQFPRDLSDENLHELMSLRIGIHSLRAKVAACEENIQLLRARTQERPHVHA